MGGSVAIKALQHEVGVGADLRGGRCRPMASNDKFMVSSRMIATCTCHRQIPDGGNTQLCQVVRK